MIQLANMIHLAKWLLPAALMTLAAALPAGAGSLHISPILLSLNQKAPVGIVTLENQGRTMMLLEIRAKAWTQRDGQQQLVEDPALIVTPSTLILKPGESRRLRAGFLAGGNPPAEQAWRLEISELPSETPGRAIHMRMQFSIPLFYEPLISADEARKTAAISGLSASLRRERGNRLTLETINGGARHLRLLGLRLQNGQDDGKTGTIIPLAQGLQSYVLAGSRLRQEISELHITGRATLLYTKPGTTAILEQALAVSNETLHIARD